MVLFYDKNNKTARKIFDAPEFKSSFSEFKDVDIESEINKISFADGESFDEIFKFYDETGFLYPGKKHLLFQKEADIKGTWNKILSGIDPVKVIFYKDKGSIIGSAMSAEYTDSSWIFQHICVLPQYRRSVVPKLISLANTYAGLINENVNNAMIFYQSHTRWARKSFEGFKKRIGDKNIVDIYPMAYLYFDLGKAEPETYQFGSNVKIEIIDGKNDIEMITAKLAESNPKLYLDSFGLNAQEWGLQKAKSDYNKHGLERNRTYLAVKNDGGEIIAVAFCDITSRGISFSNFFDHFQIFKMSSHFTYNALAKLVSRISQIYKKAGRSDIFCLCSDRAITDMLQTLGFVYLKIYNGCVFNRNNNNFDKFFDYLAHNRKEMGNI